MNNNRLVDTKVWSRVVTLIENEILSVGNHRVRRVYVRNSESRFRE
jgi:hypothetical protein